MTDWVEHHVQAESFLRSAYRAASVGNFTEAASFARQAEYEAVTLADELDVEAWKKEAA